jgi:hypothetical protein
MVMQHARRALLFLLGLSLGLAQYPGQYPDSRLPSPYPQIPRIPKIPRKKKPPEEQAYTQSIVGILYRLNAKQIVLETDDHRVLLFKRTEKTKFLNASGEAKPEDFKVGDHLTIDCTEDEQNFLYAVTVTWEKAGSEQDRARASRHVWIPTEESRDTPPPGTAPPNPEGAKPESAKPAESTEPAVEMRDPGPPVAIGADDPGPPVLKRGAPERRPVAEAPETAASLPPPQPETPAPQAPQPDPLIEQARNVIAEYNEKLPNYICQQVTTRYYSTTHPVSWVATDVVSANVVFENGTEHYRNVKVNGKESKKGILQIGGTSSRGEFATMLTGLFAPSTNARFYPRRDDVIAGLGAAMYDYDVAREHSFWTVEKGSQVLKPAFHGSVWIEKKTGRVLRIEMEAREIPDEFPLDTIESALDYQYVRLGDVRKYILPVHSEFLSCERGSPVCVKNSTDFRNYEKFSSQSTVTYDQ